MAIRGSRRGAFGAVSNLALLVALLALLAAAGIGYARISGLEVLSVQSGSMRPTLHAGDIVVIRQNAAGLSPGDIVSYRSPQNPRLLITHRLVNYDGASGRVTTKGDALAAADPPFSADRIIGRAERVLPGVGYGLDWLQRPLGLAAVVYAPAIILVAGELLRLLDYYRGRWYRLRRYA